MKTILSSEDNLIKRIDAMLAPEANSVGGRSTTTMLPQKHSRLGIIKTDISFKIDWKTLDKQWRDPENAIKRKWYVSTFSLSERRVFRETWISDMNSINSNIEFFKWFEITDKLHNGRQSLSTIAKEWFKGENTVETVIPPLKQNKVPVKDKILTTVSFKKNKKDPEGILKGKEEIRQLLQDIGARNAPRSGDIPVGTEGKTLSDYFFNIKELLAKRRKKPDIHKEFIDKINNKLKELNKSSILNDKVLTNPKLKNLGNKVIKKRVRKPKRRIKKDSLTITIKCE